MRPIFLLPLSALVAVVAGCGSETTEQAARSVPQRDLTLVTQTSEVKFASPVEVQQVRTQHRTAPRSGPFAPKVRLASVVESAPVLAAPEPVAELASTPASDRELLPGKTVTVIPASSGPSIGTDRTDEIPAVEGRTMVARGGGTCRGRGRGPGIGRAPRPDFR
jgi:hypothetical protein